jgi:hypothetical protein
MPLIARQNERRIRTVRIAKFLVIEMVKALLFAGCKAFLGETSLAETH